MSISLDGLSALNTTDYTSSSTKELENTLNSDLDTATEDELMEACKSFEAYFIEQVYKSMQSTIPTNEDDSTSASATQLTDYYKDQLTQQYAEATSEQGTLGLAEQLYEQMKRNYNL